VRDALAALPGVTNVDVDFAAKTATVHTNSAPFDAKAAVEALAEAGFENSSVTD